MKLEKIYKLYLIILTITIFVSIIFLGEWSTHKNNVDTMVEQYKRSILIDVYSHYKFEWSDGFSIKEVKNVGMTYYSKGELTVPGITMHSGSHVYEGAVAVSRDLWDKIVSPGELVWIKATNQWYRVEDTMGPQYTNRIDVYTHDMNLAKSGSRKTDIIIVRPPVKY